MSQVAWETALTSRSRHAGVAQWWEDPAATGVSAPHQPTGWGGPYNLAAGDRYENCTAARVYTQQRDGASVLPGADGIAFFSDALCTLPLRRWVCPTPLCPSPPCSHCLSLVPPHACAVSASPERGKGSVWRSTRAP